MSDHMAILNEHAQHYQCSCAASGMELILKLHSLVDADFRNFQDIYSNANIGFEKLTEMAQYGVIAQDQETLVDDGFTSILTEVQNGRYPILSVYSDPVGWHIWVAVPDGESFRLISRAYGCDTPLEMNNLNVVRQNLNRHRDGKIHYVTYELAEPNGT